MYFIFLKLKELCPELGISFTKKNSIIAYAYLEQVEFKIVIVSVDNHFKLFPKIKYGIKDSYSAFPFLITHTTEAKDIANWFIQIPIETDRVNMPIPEMIKAVHNLRKALLLIPDILKKADAVEKIVLDKL